MTFAEMLKKLRTQAGVTQAALSADSGLSLGVIRDYEQGKKEPGLRAAVRMSRVLGVSVEAFADCVDGPANNTAARKPAKGKKGKGKK